MTKLTTSYFFYFLFVAALFSCSSDISENSVEEDKTLHEELNLSGKVFLYAPELDTITCLAHGECDCCTGNYLFLNDKEFVTIDYCEADNTYSKGTYEIKNGNVLLHYDGLSINKIYNFENEIDSTGSDTSKFLISQTNVDTSTVTMTRLDCKKNICFNTGIKEIPFASLDKKLKIVDLINQLKADNIWDKLK